MDGNVLQRIEKSGLELAVDAIAQFLAVLAATLITLLLASLMALLGRQRTAIGAVV